MNFRPIHDHVLVKRTEELESKIGGIIVPDSAKEKPRQGEVIAAGGGKILSTGARAPLEVKAGERILFGKYSGSEIKIDGQDYIVFREDDVLAVLA